MNVRSTTVPLSVALTGFGLVGAGLWITLDAIAANADREALVFPSDPAKGAEFVRSVLSPTAEERIATHDAVEAQRNEFARAEAFLRTTIAQTAPERLAEELREEFVERTEQWPCHLRDTIRVALMEVEGAESAWRVSARIGWVDEECLQRLIVEKTGSTWVDEVTAGLVFAGRLPAAMEARKRFGLQSDEAWQLAATAVAALGESGLDGAPIAERIDVITKLRAVLPSCMFDMSFESMLWRVFDDCDTDLERARVLAQIASAIDGDSDHDPTTSRSVRANVAAARLLAPHPDRELLGSVLCAIATEYGSEDARKSRDDRVACALSAFVSDECPTSPAWGVSTFRAGRYERLLGDPRRAIEFQSRIIPSDVDDLEPSGYVMEAYQNYRHESAIEISKCHEALGEFPMALDWRKRARDQYAYRSWCGTCDHAVAVETAEEIARLEDLAESR